MSWCLDMKYYYNFVKNEKYKIVNEDPLYDLDYFPVEVTKLLECMVTKFL